MRCDWISSPLVEHHLGAAQLMQLALMGDRLTGPQGAQVLDVVPHDPDRLHRLDAGFGEIEDIADRYVEDHALLGEFAERRNCHCDRQRRPQIGADRGRDEGGALCDARRRGGPDEGIAIAHVLSEPEARRTCLLGLAADFEHLGGGRESIEEHADRHQSFPARAECSVGIVVGAIAIGHHPLIDGRSRRKRLIRERPARGCDGYSAAQPPAAVHRRAAGSPG